MVTRTGTPRARSGDFIFSHVFCQGDGKRARWNNVATPAGLLYANRPLKLQRQRVVVGLDTIRTVPSLGVEGHKEEDCRQGQPKRGEFGDRAADPQSGRTSVAETRCSRVMSYQGAFWSTRGAEREPSLSTKLPHTMASRHIPSAAQSRHSAVHAGNLRSTP